MHRWPSVALLLTAGVCSAQTTAPTCQAPEARQFDFWLGEWDLTGRLRARSGADQWTETRSANSIRSVLDGCVTLENFTALGGNGLTGMSVSSWNPRTRRWQQTWADNQGGYIALTGEFTAGRMILTTGPRTLPNGTTAMNRMVFHDIAADSLVWDWELSNDGGKTWELMWGITYRRKQ